MHHTILLNGDLRIDISLTEQVHFRELRQHVPISFYSQMAELLEPLTCNSELSWSDAEETASLTDAPILAIFGDERPLRSASGEQAGRGNRYAGDWDDEQGRITTWVQDPVQFWGYMNYQVSSLLDQLADQGYVVLMAGAQVTITKSTLELCMDALHAAIEFIEEQFGYEDDAKALSDQCMRAYEAAKRDIDKEVK